MFSNYTFRNLVFLLVAILFLTACSSPEQGAEQAVESYLQALVDKDQDRLLASICPAWETDALLELDALSLIETTLSNLACAQTGSEEDVALVVCQGSIDATYGTEIQKFDLGQRTFLVVPSGADFLVCGYR